MEATKEWLASLKPGDKVMYQPGHREEYREGTVTRTTKTLVILEHARFRKSDGYSPGSTWSLTRIVPLDGKEIRATEARKAASKAANKLADATRYLAPRRSTEWYERVASSVNELLAEESE